jgi:hypothetical protein
MNPKYLFYTLIISLFGSACAVPSNEYYKYTGAVNKCRYGLTSNKVRTRVFLKKNEWIDTYYLISNKGKLQTDTIKRVNKQLYLKKKGKYYKWVSKRAFERGDTVCISLYPPAEYRNHSHIQTYIPHDTVHFQNKILYGFLWCDTRNNCHHEPFTDSPYVIYFDFTVGPMGMTIGNCKPVFWQKTDKPFF